MANVARIINRFDGIYGPAYQQPKPGLIASYDFGVAVQDFFDAWYDPKSFSVKLTANKTIATSTVTALSWDAAEWDDGSFGGGSNFYMSATGLWFISAHISWASTSATGRRLTFMTVDGTEIARDETLAASTSDCDHSYGGVYWLESGANLIVNVYQSSGANLDVRELATDCRTSIRGLWLGF